MESGTGGCRARGCLCYRFPFRRCPLSSDPAGQWCTRPLCLLRGAFSGLAAHPTCILMSERGPRSPDHGPIALRLGQLLYLLHLFQGPLGWAQGAQGRRAPGRDRAQLRLWRAVWQPGAVWWAWPGSLTSTWTGRWSPRRGADGARAGQEEEHLCLGAELGSRVPPFPGEMQDKTGFHRVWSSGFG